MALFFSKSAQRGVDLRRQVGAAGEEIRLCHNHTFIMAQQ